MILWTYRKFIIRNTYTAHAQRTPTRRGSKDCNCKTRFMLTAVLCVFRAMAVCVAILCCYYYFVLVSSSPIRYFLGMQRLPNHTAILKWNNAIVSKLFLQFQLNQFFCCFLASAGNYLFLVFYCFLWMLYNVFF